MPPAGRRLLLHLGMGKTGSTALQVAFVRNRPLLSAHDVDYPASDTDALAEHDGVTSGNGERLARALVPWLRPPGDDGLEAIDDVVVGLASTTASTTLLSSEFLCHFEEQRLAELIDRCRAVDVRVEAVLYVRDVAGHALSSYLQDLQRARCTLDFVGYLQPGPGCGFDPRLEQRVGFLRENLGPGLHLVRYDAVRSELVPDFVEQVLGIPRADLLDDVDRRINRSLTLAEATLMRAVNQRLSTAAEGRAAGDALMSLDAFEPEPWWLTPDELETLTSRFGAAVDRLNAWGVRGGPLSVRGDLQVRPRPREQSLDAVHQRLLTWLAAVVRGG